MYFSCCVILVKYDIVSRQFCNQSTTIPCRSLNGKLFSLLNPSPYSAPDVVILHLFKTLPRWTLFELRQISCEILDRILYSCICRISIVPKAILGLCGLFRGPNNSASQELFTSGYRTKFLTSLREYKGAEPRTSQWTNANEPDEYGVFEVFPCIPPVFEGARSRFLTAGSLSSDL